MQDKTLMNSLIKYSESGSQDHNLVLKEKYLITIWKRQIIRPFCLITFQWFQP